MLLGFAAVISMVAASAQDVFEQTPPETQRKPRIELNRKDALEPSVPDVVWRRNLPSHTSELSFSADGTRVVARLGHIVSVFDATDGGLVHELAVNEPGGNARSLALSATDKLAVGTANYIDLYNLTSPERVDRLPCSRCYISALTFSPDALKLAFQEARPGAERMRGIGAVGVVDLVTGRVVELPATTGRPKVSFSRDGSRLLATHITYDRGEEKLGFRVWETTDWQLLQTVAFSEWTMGSIATGAIEGVDFVAVHGNEGNIEMRDLTENIVLWSVPRIPPQFAPSDSWVIGTELNRVAIAPNGTFVVSYERPVAYDLANEAGAIVVRRARNGSILAVYDVPALADLAIAPDSKAFVYATGRDHPGTHAALVRVIQ